MSQFTHIFFDFDGVITIDKSGSYTTCQYLSKFVPNKTFDEVYTSYRVFHQDLLIGKTSHEAIWNKFCKAIETDLSLEILEDSFKKTPLNPEVIKLSKKLNEKYKIGIITDNSIERIELITKEASLNKIYEPIIVSGKVGSKKKEEAIFMEALSQSSAKPENCIFIDNNKGNLIVPTELGFRTIYYDHEKRDVEQLKRDLKQLGIGI